MYFDLVLSLLRYPAALIKESTLLVNIAVIGSYDYPSNYGSDWLDHMTTNVVELEVSMATQGNIILQYVYTRQQYFGMATRGNTILQYGYTDQYNASVWLHGPIQYFSMATWSNTINTSVWLYRATQYFTMATWGNTILQYGYMGNTILQYGYTQGNTINTSVWLHGATQYFTMATQANTMLQHGYAGQHSTSKRLHRATQYFTVATQGNNTSVWLCRATHHFSMAMQGNTVFQYGYTGFTAAASLKFFSFSCSFCHGLPYPSQTLTLAKP